MYHVDPWGTPVVIILLGIKIDFFFFSSSFLPRSRVYYPALGYGARRRLACTPGQVPWGVLWAVKVAKSGK